MFSDHFRRHADQPDSPLVRRFAGLLDDGPNAAALETLARDAQRLTRAHFGRAIRLFAPLYLSNECINTCKYCGFSRDNPILRVTLAPAEVEREARHLASQGFRHILLVAGEHPRFVTDRYLEDITRTLHRFIPALSLEVGPMETADYQPIVQAGAEGLVVYQETYDRTAYAALHTAGPKKDFDWRLDCPDRAYAAGFRRLGIGALLGLAPWRQEALRLAAHVEYLQRHCWKAFLTVSFPRLRPAAGSFEPPLPVSNRDLTRLICAFRICFPHVGLILSTREPAALRDGLIPLGVTHISAGSHTEPGGYTGAGHDALHQTVRGRIVSATTPVEPDATATEQFQIADTRSPAQMAQRLTELGFDPVWKDWDPSLIGIAN